MVQDSPEPRPKLVVEALTDDVDLVAMIVSSCASAS